jgi:hypothetical protein
MKALMVAFMGLVASIWIVLLCAKIYSNAGFVNCQVCVDALRV